MASSVYDGNPLNSWSFIKKELESRQEDKEHVYDVLCLTLGQIETMRLYTLGKRTHSDDIGSNKSASFKITCTDVSTHFPDLLCLCAFFVKKHQLDNRICNIAVQIILSVVSFLDSSTAFKYDPIVSSDTVRSPFVKNVVMNRAITDALLQEVIAKKSTHYDWILSTLSSTMHTFDGVWLQICKSGAMSAVLEQDSTFVPHRTPMDESIVTRSKFVYNIVRHQKYVGTDEEISRVLSQCCRMFLVCVTGSIVYETDDMYWSWKTVEQLCCLVDPVRRRVHLLNTIFSNVQEQTAPPERIPLVQFLLSRAGLKRTAFPIVTNDQETIIVALKILITLVSHKPPSVIVSFSPDVMTEMLQAVKYIHMSIQNHLTTHKDKFITPPHKKNYEIICDLAQTFQQENPLRPPNVTVGGAT